jgi:hypothetical protein
MKTLAVLIVCLTSVALAEDFKTIDGREYKNATVSRVEPDGIVLVTKSGISKIYFVELPKEVQEGFHYDPAKIAAEQKAVEDKRIEEQKAAERERAEREENAEADIKQSAENSKPLNNAHHKPIRARQKELYPVKSSYLPPGVRTLSLVQFKCRCSPVMQQTLCSQA